MSNEKQSQADLASGAVFMIGMGLLFVTGWWWPGMLFVIAASSFARVMADGRSWTSEKSAIWMVGIGLIFALNLPWGAVLIIIGLSMFWNYSHPDDSPFTSSKRKNDEKPKNDDSDIDYI